MRSFLVLSALAVAAESSLVRPGLFTPLKNDEHPCVAENLKESHRYICDDDAQVICLSGWREPEDSDLIDLKNPCPQPICDYDNKTCVHGDCVRPNVCACKVGWEGHLCDRCVPLPGCDQGTCNEAFECNCLEKEGVTQWEGAFCDRPACPSSLCDPKHGQCFEPLECTCHDGWTGEDCKTCEKLPGCLNGNCANGDRPNTCECNEGWTGHLCDVPICSEGCSEETGYCEKPNTCLCKAGWEGSNCTDCVKYWECPNGGSCIEPNQCICDASISQRTYCNREIINGPLFEQWGECSNPCKHNPTIEAALNISSGLRKRACRWHESGSCPSPYETEACYGTRDWQIITSGTSDYNKCVYVS